MVCRDARFTSLLILLLTSTTLLARGAEAAQATAPASQVQTPTADPPYFKDFLRDERDLWTGLVKKDTYTSHGMLKYGIPFALLSAALIATDSKTGGSLPNSEDQLKWSSRVSQVGSPLSLTALSGGTYLVGRITSNEHAQETGLLAIHAIGHAQIVAEVVKQLTNRRRPTIEGGTADFWNGGDSFPSGHATTAFAVATVFSYEYRHKLIVPIFAYTAAGVVAASRVSAQRHWLSDVVVGSSSGFLIGRYVYKRHHDSSLPGSPVTPRNHFVPEVSLQTTALSLQWEY